MKAVRAPSDLDRITQAGRSGRSGAVPHARSRAPRRARPYTRPVTTIHTTPLECGARLVTERMPGVRSLGLAWLVPLGSARDPADRLGAGAILEELVCRGAGDLDSRAHADALDRLGASIGTRTETFHLAVTATLLGARAAETLPLVADMILRPKLDAAQLPAVKDLCVQAIEGLADDPQERVMLELRRRHAPPPINQIPLGSLEGVAACTHEDVAAHWRRGAVPNGSIIALAGDVDHDDAVARFNTMLAGWTGEARPVSWDDDAAERGRHHLQDDTNQVHIALAYDAPPEPDAHAFTERVATAVLSGGMSCRLFTEVREKRSLCYSVYAAYAADAKYGRTVAYAGTTPERAQETLDVLLGELRRLRTPDGRVTREEFDRAVIGLKSRLVMSGESSGARAGALARDIHKLGRPRSLDELAAQVDAVTLDGLNAYLDGRPMGRITGVTIGPSPLTIPD